MLSTKQGNKGTTGTIYITSLILCGPWLENEPVE